jgi:uncharacterized protein YxeA
MKKSLFQIVQTALVVFCMIFVQQNIHAQQASSNEPIVQENKSIDKDLLMASTESTNITEKKETKSVSKESDKGVSIEKPKTIATWTVSIGQTVYFHKPVYDDCDDNQ